MLSPCARGEIQLRTLDGKSDGQFSCPVEVCSFFTVRRILSLTVNSVSDLYEESGATVAYGEGAGFLDLNNECGYP
jgi:hypothetical protein